MDVVVEKENHAPLVHENRIECYMVVGMSTLHHTRPCACFIVPKFTKIHVTSFVSYNSAMLLLLKCSTLTRHIVWYMYDYHVPIHTTFSLLLDENHPF